MIVFEASAGEALLRRFRGVGVVITENPTAVAVMQRQAIADAVRYFIPFRHLPGFDLDPAAVLLGDDDATVRTLGAMKERNWFWDQGGRQIYRVVIDGLLDHVDKARAHDWIALLEFHDSAPEWTEADEEKLSAGLEYYCRHGVDYDRDSCSDVSDLEELFGLLKELNERFGVDFARTIASINSDIAEREECARYDDDEGGGFSRGSNPSSADPVTEDDVREMFKTLRE